MITGKATANAKS